MCTLFSGSTATIDTNWGPDGPDPVDSALISQLDQYGQMGSDMLQVRGWFNGVGGHTRQQLKDIIVAFIMLALLRFETITERQYNRI